MSILQIQEPQERKKQSAVGIDLGTTHSLVALYEDKTQKLLADENGQVLLPSCVRYTQQGIEVGHQALSHRAKDPEHTLLSVKRLMGRTANDAIACGYHCPYKILNKDAPVPCIETLKGQKTPIEISSEILKTLYQRAEQQAAYPLLGAVITVPAYFDDAQRHATKDAANIAGVKVLRLLNEPTAAAIAYGLDQDTRGLTLVYDLGGGTFDVSVLKLEKGLFQVVATGGDTALGGDDIDKLIVDWFIEQCHIESPTLELRHELLIQAKAAKEQLAIETEVELKVGHYSLTLTQNILKEMTTPLLDKTLGICKQTLQSAKLSYAEIDHVVLVGGATRTVGLKDKIGQAFQKAPLDSINPDHVVALGAARQAQRLTGFSDHDDLLLLDVTPLSLGLEMMSGVAEKIIPRNTPLPFEAKVNFTTYQDNQTGLKLNVVQGERELAQDCRSLAKFELKGIPPMKAGMAKIEVCFHLDVDGLLSVSAREVHSGVEATFDIKPSYGLTDTQINDILAQSIQHASEDVKRRKLEETRIEARRIHELIMAAITEDARLGTQEIINDIHQQLNAMDAAIEGTSVQAIKAEQEQLEKVSQSFMETRLNARLTQALKGTEVNQFAQGERNA